MDELLRKWYCDICDGPIEDLRNGYVIWKRDGQHKAYNFKIIHQSECDQPDYPSSEPLGNFIGQDGIARLLSFLSLGPLKCRQLGRSESRIADYDEFVDLFRRFQVPFYEEARRLFNSSDLIADYSDANEYYPYLPDELRQMRRKYSEND